MPMSIWFYIVISAFSAFPVLEDHFTPTYNFYLEKMWTMPDIAQNNSRLPGGGSNYCGPCATSNGLVWLSENGFPNLFDQSSQLALVQELGGPSYMNTDAGSGTGTASMLGGIKSYIEDRGYTIKRLHYQGMRWDSSAPAGTTPFSRSKISDSWMMRGLEGDAMVILGVGWYSKDGNVYEREGGHWVTMCGYDYLSRSVFITDSSGRSRSAYGNGYREWVPLTELSSSDVIQIGNRHWSGNNCYQMEGFLRVNENLGDVGILDSVIVVELEQPVSQPTFISSAFQWFGSWF